MLKFTCLLALSTLMIPSPAIYACRTMPLAPTQALKGADAVFVGTVTGKRGQPIRVSRGTYDIYYQQFEFRIEQQWKGAPGETILVATGGSDCDSRFAKGRRFLVFAFAHGYKTKPGHAILTSSVRSGTRHIGGADGYLKELGPPKRTR